MCKKWVQDWDSITTDQYNGNHGNPSEGNQKDHAKKLGNLSYTHQDLLEEKRKWHEGASSTYQNSLASGNLAMPWNPPGGGAVASHSVASEPPPSRAAPPPPPPPPPPAALPAGWKSAFDAGSGKHYYYHELGATTWDFPQSSHGQSGEVSC
mmetsp:Transcript_146268/g.467329  ORF Transcript_146268/g.467329 Transcript_146268/m.467329 type:complete len:152 (+) Transcript_146268:864-1319(+)